MKPWQRRPENALRNDIWVKRCIGAHKMEFISHKNLLFEKIYFLRHLSFSPGVEKRNRSQTNTVGSSRPAEQSMLRTRHRIPKNPPQRYSFLFRFKMKFQFYFFTFCVGHGHREYEKEIAWEEAVMLNCLRNFSAPTFSAFAFPVQFFAPYLQVFFFLIFHQIKWLSRYISSPVEL